MKQKDSLSLIFFNFIIYNIINNMKKIKARYVMRNNIQILYYADDVMLFAKSENDLQRFLHKYNS